MLARSFSSTGLHDEPLEAPTVAPPVTEQPEPPGKASAAPPGPATRKRKYDVSCSRAAKVQRKN